MLEQAREVLEFWFGPRGSADYGQARKEWFVKDPAFDEQIRARFGALHARAQAGELKSWEDDPDGLLALTVLFDQFSRNMYRDTPRAFASDAQALACARKMVERGWDMDLPPVVRAFVYLPYEHSEHLVNQDEGLRLFQRVLDDPAQAETVEWARKHREVIRRFGRFPHRNAILGRESTPEEEAFLREPGSRF
jgi:uncharacterized protein (DUF924 family)